jgi:hypothetical protein
MKGTVKNTETYIDDRPMCNPELEEIYKKPNTRKIEHNLIIVGADIKPYKQSPRLHGTVKHKLSDIYKNLNPIELEFLTLTHSRHSFISSYFNHFGFGVKTIDQIEGMWKRKEDILEYESEKQSKSKPKSKRSK